MTSKARQPCCYTGTVPRLRRSALLQLARAVAVVWLCLGTPAVLDIITDTASWMSGAQCCADDCDESGAPCTQLCVHCSGGGHHNTLPSIERTRVAVRGERGRAQSRTTVRPLSGHLEPPFRPPVS